MTFPAGPEAIDAAWLEELLRREGGLPSARLRRVTAERIGEGFGFVGVVARLTLDGDAVPRTLVAKWSPAADASREARFHRETAASVDAEFPRVLATAVDAESPRAVLILDDVAPAKQGDVLVGASPAEAAALIDAMARFHAPWWNAGAAPPLASLPRWGSQFEDRVHRTNLGLPRFLELWGDRLPPAARAAALALPARLRPAYEALRSGTPTLIHADLHLDNVLFRPDGTPVILDWADAAVGPAAVDLARLLLDGLPARDRTDAVRRRLAERYANEMAVRGVADLRASDVLADVGRMATVALAGEVRSVARGGEHLPDHPRVRMVVDAEILCIAEAAAELWPV